MTFTRTAIAAALILGTSATANAAMTVSSTAFAGYDPAAQSVVIDFDHALPPGVTVTGGLIRTADDGLGAQPAIAPGVKGISHYWSINAGDPGTLMSAIGYGSVSFLWGSMDAYNTISLLGAGGAVLQQWTGGQVYQPSNGDQLGAATNRRVTFTTDGAAIHGLRLESNQPAFEVDDIAFAQAVPEPATWAMMLLGFGAVGYSMRRRKANVRIAYAV